MVKATSEEWAKLYEQAIKLKNIKPWEYFSFLDTITIKLPEREIIYYVSIEDHFGIITINILRDILNYTKYIETCLNTEASEYEIFNLLCDTDVYTMCIGDRKSGTKEQLRIIKELGLTFRGNQDWIFFLSKRRGYTTTDPEQHEVLFMTECIEQIYQATEYYLRKKMDINFDEGYSLCRYYNDDEKKWLTYERKVNLEKEKIEFHTYTNEIQLQRVKRLQETDLDVELDITYIKSKMMDEHNKDIFVRMLLIADKNQGRMMLYKILMPTDNLFEETIAALFQVMEKHGKINKICYKSDLCEGILYDFCNKAGINIFKESYLYLIGHFLERGLEEN